MRKFTNTSSLECCKETINYSSINRVHKPGWMFSPTCRFFLPFFNRVTETISISQRVRSIEAFISFTKFSWVPLDAAKFEPSSGQFIENHARPTRLTQSFIVIW